MPIGQGTYCLGHAHPIAESLVSSPCFSSDSNSCRKPSEGAASPFLWSHLNIGHKAGPGGEGEGLLGTFPPLSTPDPRGNMFGAQVPSSWLHWTLVLGDLSPAPLPSPGGTMALPSDHRALPKVPGAVTNSLCPLCCVLPGLCPLV